MAYVKTTWTDRIVQNPLTYTQQTNADGTITLIPNEGTITQSGTPITADALNHMEDGIANALPMDSGGTVNGPLTIDGNVVSNSGFLSAWGAGSTGGYSFTNDAGNDTGMFSNADGVLSFYCNAVYSLEMDGNYFKPHFSNGNWLTIGDGLIQNTTGNGNLNLYAGSGGGYVQLCSPTDEIRTLSNGLRVANTAYDGYVPCYASSFVNMSSKKFKKNINSFKKSGLDLVKKVEIKTFELSTTDEDGFIHIGVIAEESPTEILDKSQEGADVYQMTSIAWKAIQELSAKVDDLTKEIQTLKNNAGGGGKPA